MFGYGWVEILFGEGIGGIAAPSDEVFDGTLGTVGIEDFEAVALLLNVDGHGLKCFCGLKGEQGKGTVIAIDAGAYEIVGAEVSDVEHGVGYNIADIHEGGRIALRGVGGAGACYHQGVGMLRWKRPRGSACLEKDYECWQENADRAWCHGFNGVGKMYCSSLRLHMICSPSALCRCR